MQTPYTPSDSGGPPEMGSKTRYLHRNDKKSVPGVQPCPQQRDTMGDNSEAPVGYIPGYGRGATAFITSSDIGSARPGGGAVPGVSRDTGDYSDSNFDKFSGFSQNLFGEGTYDKEDEEADRIYARVDEIMDSRRKRQREENLEKRLKKMRAERPRIADQFADVKKTLATVSNNEWNAIPEVGDHSLKYKIKKRETLTPVPDHILTMNAEKNQLATHIDPRVNPSGGSVVDLKGFAVARSQMLSYKLDKMSDNVSGQTVVDPRGFLTGLDSLDIRSDAEIGDITRARKLMTSARKTNPTSGRVWIAAARLEEFAGQMVAARRLIKKGCEACPNNEDVWMEATRLHPVDDGKVILASAVHHLPNSVKIWLHAAKLETADEKKRLVLRRALEFVPNSVSLWKAAIELEDETDALILLSRAVECVPDSVELWLALAKLETYENAKRVLNKARQAIPTEPLVWITAAELEETEGNAEVAKRIVQKGGRRPDSIDVAAAVQSLTASQHVVISRERWLTEATAAEKTDCPATATAIVAETLNLTIEKEDRERTWLGDAEKFIADEAYECARTIFRELLAVFRSVTPIWEKYVALEQKHGTEEAVSRVLEMAVEAVPRAENLWLTHARRMWQGGNVSAARMVLQKAFAANSDSEDIWLAAVDLEWESGDLERARVLLEKARTEAPTPRVWTRCAVFEWVTGNLEGALKTCAEAAKLYPCHSKLWMMAGQICTAKNDLAGAKKAYSEGLRHNVHSVALWCLSARLAELEGDVPRARSILEFARLQNRKSAGLWLESVEMELRNENEKLADVCLAKGIQECPSDGELWAMWIQRTTRPQQKRRSMDAMKACDNNAVVVKEVARLFWRERKPDKARRWFTRAVTLDEDYGDAWAQFYRFEAQCGDEASQAAVLQRCVAAAPKHGRLWCSIAKLPENRRKTVEQLLLLVAAAVPQPR